MTADDGNGILDAVRAAGEPMFRPRRQTTVVGKTEFYELEREMAKLTERYKCDRCPGLIPRERSTSCRRRRHGASADP